MMNLPMKEAILDFISDLKRKIKASDKSVHEKLAIDEYVFTLHIFQAFGFMDYNFLIC